MLKSPIIMNSCGVVSAEDRKVWNSSRKILMDGEYLDDDDGRLMLKTWYYTIMIR